MKFLETITIFDNDVLVPIDRIKFINFSYITGYVIKIVSDDGDWEEHFDTDQKKAETRYEQIKKIVNGK